MVLLVMCKGGMGCGRRGRARETEGRGKRQRTLSVNHSFSNLMESTSSFVTTSANESQTSANVQRPFDRVPQSNSIQLTHIGRRSSSSMRLQSVAGKICQPDRIVTVGDVLHAPFRGLYYCRGEVVCLFGRRRGGSRGMVSARVMVSVAF